MMLSTLDTSEARQMRSLGIRYGAVGLAGQDAIDPALDAVFASLPKTTLDLTLGEDAETFRWLQTEVQSGGSVPLLEAEAVVRSLSVAMHGDSRMVLPLLKLKEFDQYTTTHSLNVAVLAMGSPTATLPSPTRMFRSVMGSACSRRVWKAASCRRWPYNLRTTRSRSAPAAGSSPLA